MDEPGVMSIINSLNTEDVFEIVLRNTGEKSIFTNKDTEKKPLMTGNQEGRNSISPVKFSC